MPVACLLHTLPSPTSGHDDSESIVYGPAVLFESGPVDVNTMGTTGTGGSVTSNATE